MKKLTVEELFDINDCLLSANSIQFDYFDEYGKVFMIDTEGDTYSWIVPLREIKLLKKDFYTDDLFEIIELTKKYKKKIIRTDYNNEDFPITFEVCDKFDQIIKSVKCNVEECMFILKCSKLKIAN